MDESTNNSVAGNTLASAGAFDTIQRSWGNVKETFNKAGGNEIVSNISASVPQGTKDYISEAKLKFFNFSYLRSPKVFFGIGEEKPFYVERTVSLILPRVQHNMTFFYLNYMVITAILFLLTVLINPMTIIAIGMLGLVWMVVIKTTSEGSVSIKGITVTQKQASIVMACVSVFVLIKILSGIFWWTLAASGVLTGAHGLLRDASMHKDEEDKVKMTGDVSGEESAAFLSSASNVDFEDVDVV